MSLINYNFTGQSPNPKILLSIASGFDTLYARGGDARAVCWSGSAQVV